jgi:hypothetical protein
MSRYQGGIITKSPATPTGPTITGRAPGIWRMDDVAYWTKQGVWPNANIQAPDTYFPYVSLLLSTTSLGNANNNLFVDSSGAFNPITRNGNTTQGSATPYGASWSNYFDGTGDYLTVPDDNALDFGTGDFTIEMWINAQNLSSVPMFFHKGTSVSTGWFFQTSGSTLYFGQLDSNRYSTWSVSLANNAWYHIALTRVGAVLNVFVNGVSQGAQTVTNANLSNDNTGLLYIGEYINGTYYYQGYLSNYRIVKGSAVYTSNFTVPTSNLTAISGTSLLTCQSNRFRDASTNNFTITRNGNTSVTEFSPFAPAYPGISYNQSDITNWSGYFDGTGDYLTASPTALSTGDFTFECWIYSTGTGQYQYFYDTRASTNDAAGFCVIYNHASYPNKVSIYSNGFIGTPTINIPVGAWTHYALVRSSGSWRTFVNGAADISPTSASRTLSNTALKIAAGQALDYFFNGYISNYRIVNGTAVYTSAFTPPTTNLTAISGTSLLTCQNAAFTDNSTNNFVITPSGNATVTGNSPFNTVGYWSNYFDGTNAYLTSATSSAYAMGTGDFTIEGWFFTTASGDQALWDNRASTSSAVGIACRLITSTNTLRVILNNTALFTTSQAVALNQWNHIAIVRASGTVTAYLNGTAMTGGSATGTTNITDTNMWIGKLQDAGFFYNGYISNFRVVKGTAVYTTTFTPPTSPLTAISGTSLLTCQNGRFIDNSTNAFAITVNGNTSAQSFDPFYTSTIASNGGSMYFSSTNTGALETILTVPASNTLDIGAGDFTLECWVYLTATQNYSRIIQFNNTWASAGATPLIFANTDVQKLAVASYDIGTTLITADNTYLFNTWYHVAVTRASNVFSMYINGVKQSGTYTTSTRLWATTTPFMSIGNGPTSVGGFSPMQGYVSDVRIIKGSAIYTATFTPPTAPLTPTPATTLLVNGMNAGAYDATAINDMGTVGNAQVRFPTPFAPANYWAGVFDGNGDYLTSPSNAAFALGTGDYTVECWIYATSTPSDQGIYEGRSTGTTSDGFTLTAFSGSVIRIFSGGVLVASTGTSYVGQWAHVAVTRASGTTTLWINGVSQGTSATSYNCTNTDAVVGGGRYTGGTTINTSFPGFISNFRIVKGTAVYTSAFTPSTTPLTAISGTSLLTCQNTTFIDNSTNAFTITAFGNATAGAIGPFTATGGTSTYFDGSGDNLFMPSSPSMNCGSGNWTVEGWVSTLTRTTNYPLIFGNNRGSFTTDALAITASNADSSPSYLNKFVFAWGSSGFSSPSAGTSALLVSNVTNSNGVWYHLAIVRNGTSIKMYRNGTEVASATVSAGATFNWGFNGSLAGGGNWDGAQGNWNGYLDDLRITNGIARYTANFTPPTQAFPPY